jgi:hypothetical protein
MTESEEDNESAAGALMVGIIHSISRKSDHDRNFAQGVYSGLAGQGLAQPEHILGLIKV